MKTLLQIILQKKKRTKGSQNKEIIVTMWEKSLKCTAEYGEYTTQTRQGENSISEKKKKHLTAMSNI